MAKRRKKGDFKGYLAPLNYNRFFERVFLDLDVVKAFLEDFLGKKIYEIKPLSKKHKVTAKSSYVEFDFRCKIDTGYIIVDMQQWYKSDVIKRFYVYHSLSSVLQLEDVGIKAVPISEEKDKVRGVQDYSQIEPVITLIWMVDDNLGSNENYLSYLMTPELVVDFLNESEIWKSKDIEKLLINRQKLINVLDNNTKGLSFLKKNKLIFMFQRNIVNSPKMDKYIRWFEFAEKTLNKENKKEDFDAFKEDELFRKIIGQLEYSRLDEEDILYLDNEEEYLELVKKYEDSLYKEALEEGMEKGKTEGKAEGKAEVKAEMAKNMIEKGFDLEVIEEITGLSKEEIKKIKG